MSKKKTVMILGAKSDVAIALANIFAKNKFNLQLVARGCSELNYLCKDLNIKYEIESAYYELDILFHEEFNGFIDSLPNVPDVVIDVRIGVMSALVPPAYT